MNNEQILFPTRMVLWYFTNLQNSIVKCISCMFSGLKISRYS